MSHPKSIAIKVKVVDMGSRVSQSLKNFIFDNFNSF